MLSNINDVVHAFQTVATTASTIGDHPKSLESSGKNSDSGNSHMYFTFPGILLIILFSLLVIGISMSICYSCTKARQGRGPASSSPSQYGSARHAAPRAPSRRQRLGSLWSRVFSTSEDSISWPALWCFASRLESPVGDVEMQTAQPLRSTGRQAGDGNNTITNSVQAATTISSSANHAMRTKRYRHTRMEWTNTRESTAEGDQQAFRIARDQTVIHIDQSFQTEARHRSILEQLRADLLVIPAGATPRNVGRYDHLPLPMYERHEQHRRPVSPTPSLLEPPPPTYTAHASHNVASLRNYQDPANAAEDIGGVQGLPPYAALAL